METAPSEDIAEAEAFAAAGAEADESKAGLGSVDESSAAPEDGLGAVEGDEVLAAEADATEVHQAAVEGAASAEATADVAADAPTNPPPPPRTGWVGRG